MSWSNSKIKIETQAYRAIGVLGEGDTLSGDQEAVADDWLNTELESLSENYPLIFKKEVLSIPMVAASQVTGSDGQIYTCIEQVTTPSTWTASTVYSAGDVVNPSVLTGMIYTCSTAGTSTSTEPAWDTTGTAVTSDNNVSVWSSGLSVIVGKCVKPVTANGYYYRCTVAGTTGGTGPAWDAFIGASVSDNSATWEAYQIVTFTTSYSDQPQLGLNWPRYWVARNSTGGVYSSGTTYRTPAQGILPDNVMGIAGATFLRNGIQTDIQIRNWMRINEISNKSVFGRPQIMFVEFTSMSSKYTLWPQPDLSIPFDQLNLVIYKYINLPDGQDDRIDVPRVWIPYFIWKLAANMAPSYGHSLQYQNKLGANADTAFRNALNRNINCCNDIEHVENAF